MLKKSFVIFVACCFISATLPITTFAAPRCKKDSILEDFLLSLKLDLGTIDQSGELDGIASKTQALLDELLIGLRENNVGGLTKATLDLLTEVNRVQAQPLDSECSLPLLLGVTFATLGILGDVSEGGINATCVLYNVTNGIADIISDIQSYNICLIDTSPEPDQAARQQIVAQQVLVEFYDFITDALNVIYCKLDFGIQDLISLLFSFFDIFPSPPPDTEG